MKFLLTVAIIALAWFGFRFAGRLNAQREAVERRNKSGGFKPEPDGESVKDLVKCSKCNTWRASDLGSCGRGECPY